MNRPATPKQMTLIRKLYREAGITTPAPKKGALTITEASRHITSLLNLGRGWAAPVGGQPAPAIILDSDFANEPEEDGAMEAELRNERSFEERGAYEPEDLPF